MRGHGIIESFIRQGPEFQGQLAGSNIILQER